MSTPAASVLVPVLDEADNIHVCVAAMLAQELDEDYELLLLDGGSTDGTRELLDELAAADPRIRVFDNPHRTVPYALNIGLREARAPVVVRMDAHTLYPPHYLADGLQRLRRGDTVWVSGPQLPYGVDAGTRRIALALSTSLGTGGASFRRAAAEEEPDSASGFTGLFDRAFIERLGGWDEAWAANQDAELAARVRAAGGRIVVMPALGARYVPRRTLRSLARQYRRYGIYRAKTCVAHPQSVELRHALPPALLLTGAAALLPLGPLRPAARVLMAAYAAALLTTALAAARRAPWRDAAALPAAFATMHAAWGSGFLTGCARFGVPWRGLAGAFARHMRATAGADESPAIIAQMRTTTTPDVNQAAMQHNAERYASSLALAPQEQALLGRLRGRWHELRVLDIGVGAGRTAYTFAPLAGTYVGVDYSEPMLELARARVGERDGVSFEFADARDLSRFRGAPFDVVLFSFNGIDAVSHEDRAVILGEIAGVLVPGGWFLFSGHSLDALPLASPLRRPVSRHPVRSAYRIARDLPAAVKIHRTNGALEDLEHARRRGWVVVPDDVYDVGMRHVYMLATAQVAELEQLGLEVVEVSDRAGRPVDPSRPGSDAWLHYLCRKPG